MLTAQGGERELQAALQLYANVRQGAINIYMKRTGLSAAEIGAMMDAETWMNATTAKAKGFITAISGEVAELPADTRDVLNKYHYNGVPAVLNQALATPGLRPAPAPAAPAAPVTVSNRAGWKLTDWHANDPAALATMHTTNPGLFAQLYQQHYGTPYQRSSGRERPQQAAHNTAPAPAAPAAPAAPTEPVKRSLLEQLPRLGPLLTAMLDLAGKTITAITSTSIAGEPKDMVQRERALTEGVDIAMSLVNGTQTAVYLLGAQCTLGVLEEYADDNPARRAAARKTGIDAAMWAHYKIQMQAIVRFLQQAETSAAEPTAAHYEILPAPKGREGWSLQDWLDKDPEGLRALREENPNLYRQLYHAKYGVTPHL